MGKVSRSTMIVIVLIILSITLFIGGFFTGNSKKFTDKLLQKEIDSVKNQYEQKLSEKDFKIKEKEELFKVSYANYMKLKAKIKDKENQVTNIKPPQTSEELVERFIKLGYQSK